MNRRRLGEFKKPDLVENPPIINISKRRSRKSSEKQFQQDHLSEVRQERSRSKEKRKTNSEMRLESEKQQKQKEVQEAPSTMSSFDNPFNLSGDYNLKNYLETLVTKLSLIRAGTHTFSKEMTYVEILRFVRNCEKLDLDLEFLVSN
jgi:hypothetical protein